MAEMAIVTLLIGIMLTLGISAITAQMENAAYASTRKKQDAIKDALVAYLGKNKRLPCPDTDLTVATPPDGSENRATPNDPTTLCTAAFGAVPFVTLGLSRDMAQDGWGNYFSYQVSVAPYNWTITTSFNAGSQGGVLVNGRDAVGALLIPPITSNAVAVIVSHGKNGLGAYTVKGTRNALPIAATGADELDNTNGDATYYKRDYNADTTKPGGAFDDVVLVLQYADLIIPVLQSKSVKSYDEEVSIALKDIEDIKNALIGYAMKNLSLPYADSDNTGKPNCSAANANNGMADDGNCLAGNIPWQTLGVANKDPWGTPYKYSVTTALTTPATDKPSFIAKAGGITVNDQNSVNLTTSAPFVVYSLGRNNATYFNNGAGNGAKCTAAAPVAPLTPVAPNCLGTNEINNYAGNSPFVKAPMVVPPFANPQLGYDDILDYLPKGVIDAKLP